MPFVQVEMGEAIKKVLSDSAEKAQYMENLYEKRNRIDTSTIGNKYSRY